MSTLLSSYLLLGQKSGVLAGRGHSIVGESAAGDSAWAWHILIGQRHVRPNESLLNRGLMAVLEKLVHLGHGRGLSGDLSESEVAAAATPA